MEVDARLEGLQPFMIHDTRYYRVFYSFADDPEQILECRLPHDAIDSDLKPGDPVKLTMLLKTVMEVRRSPSPPAE
jgi:hypothetical protein